MPKISLDFLKLCDFALTSKEGKLSLIGIFDRIFVKKIPTTFSRFFVVAILKGKPNTEHRLSLAIQDPQGRDVLPKHQEMLVKLGESGKSNIITDIGNFPIHTAGEYQVILRTEGEEIGKYEFGVVNSGGNGEGKPRGKNLPN